MTGALQVPVRRGGDGGMCGKDSDTSQNDSTAQTARSARGRRDAPLPSVCSECGSWTQDSSRGAEVHKSSKDLSFGVARGNTHDQDRLAALGWSDTEEGVNIIVVGVMRTGLKTLHRALRNLGYSNIYDQEDIVNTYDLWDQVLRNNISADCFHKIFQGSEVIMGMPTFCFWEQVVELYPNAKVILTVRSEDGWWESVRHAEDLMHKDMPGAPLRYGLLMQRLEAYLMPSYHRFCEVLRFAWATTLGAHALAGEGINEAIARSSYRKHNSYVRYTLGNQVDARGKPKLLVYDVSDGWEPLCKFLEKDIPEVEFPHVKNVPYFPGQQMRPDQGASFEQMIAPDSAFGIRMREELRAGLLKSIVVVTAVFLSVLALLARTAFEVPVALVAIVYVVVTVAGWNVYVVISGLVLKVPALVVLPMAVKSFLIAGALQACLLSYGVLKEMLVVQDGIASPLLVLSSRFGAITCSAALLLATERRVTLGAPILSMAAFAFTNEASTWAGYEMLKYVSFPVSVLAKSAKMLPSMLMGRALNGTHYSALQYVQAISAVVCVCTMHLAEEADNQRAGANRRGADDESQYWRLGMGMFVLLLFFVCDSFTSQWQDKLYKQYHGMTQTQMMLGGNLLGFLMTCGTLVAAWSKVRDSIGLALERPEILARLVCLGVVYALGQFCIYSAIRILGPVSFAWIMTARQLLSVLVSLVIFGHGISATKVVCISVVFAIMSAKQLAKAMPKLSKSARTLQRRLARHATAVSGTRAPAPPSHPHRPKDQREAEESSSGTDKKER